MIIIGTVLRASTESIDTKKEIKEIIIKRKKRKNLPVRDNCVNVLITKKKRRERNKIVD